MSSRKDISRTRGSRSTLVVDFKLRDVNVSQRYAQNRSIQQLSRNYDNLLPQSSNDVQRYSRSATKGPKYFDFIQLTKRSIAQQRFLTPSVSPLQEPEADLKSRNLIYYSWLLPSMAIVLFIIGIGITIQTFRANKGVEAQIATTVSNGTAEGPLVVDSDIPSEVEPTNAQIANYHVEPTAPRYVRIPEINVFARTYALGVNKQGNFRAPNNIYNAGWYEKSARPGEDGAVLLDGHSSGSKGTAVFSSLATLKAGSRIEIERGDGKKIGYKVISIESFPIDKLDMQKAVMSVKPGVNGLNLITCDGKYDDTQKTYRNRLLVRAVQE